MSKNLFSLEGAQTTLFQLLVFLIPAQLGLHFWPEWAHIFGIRVDYLSPTVYLTDLIVFLIFFMWVTKLLRKKGLARVVKIIKKYKFYWVGVLLFAFINIALSENQFAAFYKWVKIFEFSLFALFIYNLKGNLIKIVKKPLTYSLILFSLIGITQFILQKTIGGPFYFLGERSFSVTTPGIALAEVFGKEYLRTYSTFSHPNSFAGYLALALVFIKTFKRNLLTTTAFFLGLVSLFLTFSQGAIFSLVIVGLIYLLTSVSKRQKILPWVLITTVLASAALIFTSSSLADAEMFNRQEIEKRLLLTDASKRMFTEKPLIGVGANNFVVELPKLKIDKGTAWTLQPVHNIYLLVLVELGLVGIFMFFFLLKKSVEKLKREKGFLIATSLFLIVLTGLVDHYWLTLQQNQLLFSFVLGASFRIKTS